jgi:hypothetical protein
MGWHPGEVLELIRWSDPEDPDHKPGSTGRRGHQMRAFACAVLLSAASDGGYDGNEEATLAQCLSSARVLGDAMNDAVARFLTWRIPSLSCSDRWLFALGLLVVATRFRSDRITDEILAEAAAWFLDEESAFRRESGFNPADPPPAAFGLTHGFWKPLFSELIESAASIRSAKVRGDLEVIGKILQDQS